MRPVSQQHARYEAGQRDTDQGAEAGNGSFPQRCAGKNRLEQPESARLVWFGISLGHSVNQADDREASAKNR